MKYSFRLLIYTVIFIIILLSQLWLASFLAHPSYQGIMNSKHINSPVEVFFDRWGIPHIEAQSDSDAYYSLGYLIAQERLAQFELQRRAANGELSEVFGKKTLERDILIRELRIREFIKEQLPHIKKQFPKKMIDSLNAYLQGINNFIHVATKHNKLPIELRLLGITPKPFTLLDVLTFLGYMSLNFNHSLKMDLLNTHLKSILSADKYLELFPIYPEHAPYILKDKIKSTSFAPLDSPNLKVPKTNVRKLLAAVDSIQSFFQFDGSNSWVLSGKRTTNGRPLLANDPHMRLLNPSLWYESHLKTEINDISSNIHGHFLAFIPFPILANTDHHSWAFTVSYIDQLDLFQEKRNPNDSSAIIYKGESKKLHTYNERIKIKGSEDLNIKIEVGPHGPLLNNFFNYSSKKITANPTDISAKWVFHQKNTNSLLSLYQMGKAKNIVQFKFSLHHGSGPGLNISYADTKGNIAWWIYGKIPIRPINTLGNHVLDGSSGENDWQGVLDFSKHPNIINPYSGIIVTANNAVTSNPRIQNNHKDYERAFKIKSELIKQKLWSVKMTKKLQTNEESIYWNVHKPLLETMNTENLNLNEKNAFELLSNWDGVSDKKSTGALIYHTWMHYTLQEALIDDLGKETFTYFTKYSSVRPFFLNLLQNKQSLFWDDITTNKIEQQNDILLNAFKKTFYSLKEQLGSSLDDWNWGSLHTLEFSHPITYNNFLKPLLGPILNSGPYPVGGGSHHINALAHSLSQSFYKVFRGPTTRRIITFPEETPPQIYSITPPGNSGHFLSPYYSNQSQMYVQKQYRQKSLDFTKLKIQSKKQNHRNLILFTPLNKAETL